MVNLRTGTITGHLFYPPASATLGICEHENLFAEYSENLMHLLQYCKAQSSPCLGFGRTERFYKPSHLLCVRFCPSISDIDMLG